MENLYIAVINGPNLNKLGQRRTDIYGEEPFEVTLEQLKIIAGNDFRIEYSQSNSEGEIIDLLQKHGDQNNSNCAGIILNPGAYAHYSYAIADAVRDVCYHRTVIEVHISNIFSRETFREKSVTAEAASGLISGLGRDGYKVALNYIMDRYKKVF